MNTAVPETSFSGNGFSEHSSLYGILYLVATPVGNLGDISPRALEILRSADFIAAEDTRVTVKLLNHFDIRRPLVSYHEHNHVSAGQSILKRLQNGESCALVTDAGTPAISDPGEELVRLCAENGVTVSGIPGCCAAVNALAVSGLPTGRFVFEGFLSVQRKNRMERLEALRNEPRTMIFYEAPHKLCTTLADLCAVFGSERAVTLCREMTKVHEEIVRTTLGGALAHCQEMSPRGEYVLVVAGAEPSGTDSSTVPFAEAVAEVERLHADGLRLKDAVQEVALRTGHARNVLYHAAAERHDKA